MIRRLPGHAMNEQKKWLPALRKPQRMLSAEHRRTVGDASKAHGAWPPAVGKPSMPEEDAILATMTDKEAAQRMCGSWQTVNNRRRRLGAAALRKDSSCKHPGKRKNYVCICPHPVRESHPLQ
jgi:hypothetical protein